jgi:ketosteroid isomerase-like protein
MAGPLEIVVREMFDGLDKADRQAVEGRIGSDAEGIDEISRRWLRGAGELHAYVAQLMEMAGDVHSEMRDVHETVWGDTGKVTFWLEQDYTLEGERQHVSAPTSVVLRREDGTWKVELFHSVPMSNA